MSDKRLGLVGNRPLPLLALGLTLGVFLLAGGLAFATFGPNPVRDCAAAQQLMDDFPYSAKAQGKAKRLLVRAYNEDSDYGPALIGLARASTYEGYINNDNYESESLQQALTLLNRALELDSASVEALIEKGFVLAYQKRFDEAAVLAKRAETIAPKEAKTGLLRAKIAAMQGDSATAARYAQAVIQHTDYKPYKRRAYSYVADYNEDVKRYPQAEAAFQASMDLYPDDPWIKNNYCALLVRMGSFDRAIELGEASIKLMNFGMIRINLSEAYYGKGYRLFWTDRKYVEALPYFERSLELDPYPNTYWMLGLCLREKARQDRSGEVLERSKQAFESALELDPKHKASRDELQRHMEAAAGRAH